MNHLNHSAESNPVIGIIGGGVAGMSCALWLKQLGLSPHIIECNATLGGQLLGINRINRWVIGSPDMTSIELAHSYSSHIRLENIPVSYNTQLIAIEPTGEGYRLVLQESKQNQSTITVQSLVIATGARALGHEIFNKTPEFDLLTTAGLINCFPTDHLDKLAQLHGKTVVVIGGGDNAHFTVKDLASVAARIYLLIRSRPKAQSKIRKEIEALIKQGRVIEYLQTALSAVRQAQDAIEISLNTAGSAAGTIEADMIFTRTGFVPNTEFLNKLAPLAHIKKIEGYLSTDSVKQTSLASVYAIGDVASPELKSVVTAIADGAIAARSIAQHLNARE